MEQIIALFEGYRENQLSFDQLYTTLLEKAQQDASFRHQAIPTIDQVQKSTPIPITNFIELRSQLESELQNLPPSVPNNALPQDSDYDPEATLITALPEEETHPNAKSLNEQHSDSTATGNIAPHDPTLIATSTSTSTNNTDIKEQTIPPSSPQQDDDDDDEATVIMSADKLGSLRSAAPATAQHNIDNSEEDDDEEETLITPATATSTGMRAEAEVETADHDAATLVGAENTVGTTPSAPAINNAYGPGTEEKLPETFSESFSEPSSNPEQDTPNTTFPSKNIIISAGAGVVIVAILISFFWLSASPSTNLPTASSADNTPKTETPKEESWGSAPAILQPPKASPSEPKNEPEITLSTPTTEQAVATSESNQVTTDNTVLTDNTVTENPVTERPIVQKPIALEVIVQKPTIPEVITQEAIAEQPVERMEFSSSTEEADYLFKQITLQEESNNLGPAEKVGTATYYLVRLIKLKPGSPLISKARSRIAKAHLALANTARENENWDDAQQHLDDAFTVRLPDSYQ